MEVDREYNACKALDPQIDSKDDVYHNSPDYEINEQELQTQMWLGGLHGCNEWAGGTRRSGFSGGLLWTGADGADSWADRANSIILGGIQDWADWSGRGRLADAADAAEYGILDGVDWGEQANAADAADYRILDVANGGGLGRMGQMGRTGWKGGRMGWTGADGADGVEWRTGRTRADRAEGGVMVELGGA